MTLNALANKIVRLIAERPMGKYRLSKALQRRVSSAALTAALALALDRGDIVAHENRTGTGVYYSTPGDHRPDGD